MDETTDRRGVVVGFDGSAPAAEALRHAVAEAALRNLALRVVVAHEPPDLWSTGWGVPPLPDSGAARQAVEESARARVEDIRGTLDEAGRAVPVDLVAITGPAAAVLAEQARDAVLLVVGHRGRGGVRSALLGSVGLSVALHAPCPVTIVPTVPRAQDPA
jgi:nucleotide-binding universal stress UspA family protein